MRCCDSCIMAKSGALRSSLFPIMSRYDPIVIGGGLVGSAIAYGLARGGLKAALLDEGDIAFRASRGNFGLVWGQSKGIGVPEYQRWCRLSSPLGGGFAVGLRQETGIDWC